MPTDLEILQAAHILVKKHGDKAVEAAQRHLAAVVAVLRRSQSYATPPDGAVN